MKNTFGCFPVLMFILFISNFAYADPPRVGDIAPSFIVRAGDNKAMTLDQLKGKVIVMFYNSKDTTGQDSVLRQELNKFYNDQPEDRKQKVYKLAIVDCSSAFFPVDYIWKKKLIDTSKEKKMDIYGDWDGNVAKSYSFSPDCSNIVIIDKDGIIRFVARKEIRDQKEINAIVALLNKIT
ncbi:MAG TPA: hypothetical protein DD381_05265 [Lentisphaeria bacterium]|nr:MAG: hypothetical protein A2X47_06150 [Lentisphaerae bacterium GWF2_38_69]HBM15741.1 hypothetical protein [Lentisphaeria bacterium]